MKKLTFLFFLLQFIYAFSQNVSEKSKQEIDSLLTLSRNGMLAIELTSTLQHGIDALTKSNKYNYSEGKSRAYYYIANALYESSEYKKALTYLSESLKEDFAKQTPQLITDIHRVRGRVYGNLEMNDISANEFHRGLSSATKIKIEQNRKYTQNLLYENLVFLYLKTKKLDSAWFYLDKNTRLIKTQDENFMYPNKISQFNALGEYYLLSAQYDSAFSNLKKGIKLSNEFEHPYRSALYNTLGDVYYKIQDKDSAKYYFLNAIENIKITGIETELPVIYEKLSSLYKELNEPQLSESYYLKALQAREKLTYNKIEAGETVVKILLSEKKDEKPEFNYFLIVILSVFSLVLFGLTLYYWKSRIRIANKRQIIADNEKILFQKKLETKELKLNESFEKVVALAKENNPEFLTLFSEVYSEFYQKLISIEPKLIKSEIRFCALLFLNFSTKDIAQYTFVTVKAVQHSRFRLRKKLNIPSEKLTS